MRRKRLFSALTFLAALLLLLTACSQAKSTEEQLTDDFIISPDGSYYTTDGNIWYPLATDGNYYATDGDWYATDGDYYNIQNTPYATDGNVDAGKLTTVHVSSVDELLAAIAPETEILVAPGEYNLSRATPALYSYCYFRPTYPVEGEVGNELVLCNLYDCVIASESGESGDVTLIAEPRSAAVLKIEDSYGVQLRGLTLGHSEGAICSGDVLRLENCGSVFVEGCELYGCGTVGLNGQNCWGVTLADSLIRDCSYSGVEFFSSESVLLRGVRFRNAGENACCRLSSSHWVEIEDCGFADNRCSLFLSESWCDHVFFDDCAFENNDFRSLFEISGSGSPELWHCDIPAEQYGSPYSEPSPEVFALMNGKVF